jgi:protocatechuate 3,4-dioxygenase beta subunit
MAEQPPTFEGRALPDPDEPAYDQGLQFDLGTLFSRRRVLGVFGGAAAAAFLTACGGGDDTPSANAPGTSATASDATEPTTEPSSTDTSNGEPSDVEVIPEETAGPYPGDGSNGPDVLAESGVVRSDITTSFGRYSGTAGGVPMSISFQILDADNGGVAYAGAAVYAWHCDREGRYSLYSQGATDQNYLRGVQECDADGTVTFQSIFPACYSGRWPHIHFEVYPTLAAATDVANKIATSQIAIPADICGRVYDTVAGYEASVSNFANVSLATDNVFGDDGGVHELGALSGSIDAGLGVFLSAAVSATTQAVVDGPVGGRGPGGGPPPDGSPTGGPPPGGSQP